MENWINLLIIALAGALGGVVNALLSQNGFLLPRPEKNNGDTIFRPGFLGNVAVGALGACLSWSLYGPATDQALTARLSLTVSALAGALLVGVAGSRWLTNEVDKQLLRTAASNAIAAAVPGSDTALAVQNGSPSDAFHITKALRRQADSSAATTKPHEPQ
jgi:hypothetical protein